MKNEEVRKSKKQENEKGAAMVMVILVSFLLLVACAGLLLETTMNTSNVTDAVAEQQAYYAAESGIQSALNVLRGNTEPLTASTESSSEYWASSLNPLNLIETTASASASPSPTPNKIDFRKAVTPGTSNHANDPSTEPRLSRWINYNYTSPGKNYPDRVSVGSGNNGAFSLAISDPDKTGDIISFKTRASIYDPFDSTPRWKDAITLGGATNNATIAYYSSPKSNLNVADGAENTNFGTFVVMIGGTGAILSEDLRFQIVVDMTAPYTTTRVIRGWILKGTFNSASQVVFVFDTPASEIMGSIFSLSGLTSETIDGLSRNNLLKVSANSIKTINGSVTQAEPTRVIVKSTGYGPRGAKKQLETVVQKNFFNGMTAPATLTLVGPPTASNGNFTFYAGASQNVTYSGDDMASNVVIPSIGATNEDNLDDVFDNLGGKSRKADVIGYPANVDAEMPFWLQSTHNLDATIQALRTVAQSSGRYFTNGQKPAKSDFGDRSTATGITFVEGDVSLSGNGGGILVCTGKLTLDGGFDFNGLIVVTGANGLNRNGGGNGLLRGNVVIAPYNPNNLNAGFLAPKYDISGGGTSEIRYDSDSLANGMTAVSNFVLGVAEK